MGCVDELLLDVGSGRVEYVVLSCGAGEGVDGRRVVVPWRWLRFEPRSERFHLTVERPALAAAPGLREDDWPDFSDGRLQRRLSQHFDHSTRLTPVFARRAPQPPLS